jgi:lipoprotein NlpD
MSGILTRALGFAGCAAALALTGCGSTSLNHAPVEDRGVAGSTATSVTPAVKPPPGFENAGKPGYYTVKPGDTLIRIGLENGQNQKDIARWNTLENPNKIEVGQVLRVVPPAVEGAAVTKPVTSGAVVVAPIAPNGTVPPAKTASGSDDDLGWIWPGKGAVIAEFDETKNKGVDIAGSAGDAVLAAADGKVVYAGAGLRGYGNLIILKHNNTYLTAYAHNQGLLVKEDQSVKKGQKIAEMGSSDADRVKLHFEVRRQGKPVDPLKYLPAR